MSDVNLDVRKTDRDTSRITVTCETCDFRDRCMRIYEICIRNPKNWDGHSFCSACGQHNFVHNVDNSCPEQSQICK